MHSQVPLQWCNQILQSLEEGARKWCSEYEPHHYLGQGKWLTQNYLVGKVSNAPKWKTKLGCSGWSFKGLQHTSLAFRGSCGAPTHHIWWEGSSRRFHGPSRWSQHCLLPSSPAVWRCVHPPPSGWLCSHHCRRCSSLHCAASESLHCQAGRLCMPP